MNQRKEWRIEELVQDEIDELEAFKGTYPSCQGSKDAGMGGPEDEELMESEPWDPNALTTVEEDGE